MNYTLVALGVLVLGVVGFFLMRQRHKVRNQGVDRIEKPVRISPLAQWTQLQKTDRFWGYRVESHCRASSRLAGREYSFDEGPPLPVQGCEATNCTCRLIGMPERRTETERRSGEDRRSSIRMDDSDRRTERPRRKADINSWVSYGHL